LRFIKNGQLIAEGADWYWFNVGFITGYKQGIAGLSSNWRGWFEDYSGD